LGAFADPAAALQEFEDRTAAARSRTLTGAPQMAARENFEAKNDGYWVVVFANERFMNQYEAPALLLVRFFPQYDRAADFVCRMAADPEVKLVPSIVRANKPALIPHSDASVFNADHTIDKINRAAQRTLEFHKYRKEEFANYVRTHQPGESKVSDYHRSKTRLLKERVREIREGKRGGSSAVASAAECAAIDAILAAPLPRHDFETLKPKSAGVNAGTAAVGSADALHVMHDSKAGKLVQYDPASFADVTMEEAGAAALARMFSSVESGTGTETDTETASATAGAEAPAAVATAGASADAAGAGSGAGSGAVSVPAPLLSDAAIPKHWQSREREIDDVWPMKWTDGAGYAIITVVDDYDLPDDDPEFRDAAGMEPMVILWGGQYDKEEEAKRVIEEEIAPWCDELTLDVVCKHRLLVPSKVDPDKIEEKGRAGCAEFTNTWNSMLKHNKVEKRQIELLREKNVDVPVIAAAATAAGAASIAAAATAAPAPPPVILVGAVQQFDEEHQLLNHDEVQQKAYVSGLPPLDL
jgi:hypothetical protein